MRARNRKFLPRLARAKNGNAAVIVGLALPILIGGAGYGVDTAQWYLWKRELQHAVDQAALAGGYALFYNGKSGSYRERAQQEYDHNRQITLGNVTASSAEVDLVDHGSGLDNSVVVRATITASLPFSSLLSGQGVTINVASQSVFEPGTVTYSCMIGLKKTGTVITLNGNINLNAPCGMTVPSSHGISVEKNGGAGYVNPGWVLTPGGVNDTFEQKAAESGSTIEEGGSGMVDPFESLEPPPETGTQHGDLDCKGGSKTVSPGTYTDFKIGCHLTMRPGVYFLRGGDLKLNANRSVTSNGQGVLIVLMDGAEISIAGSGNANLTGLSETQARNLGYTGEALEKMTNMLIFEDAESTPNEVAHSINGNSTNVLNGRVYLPKGNLAYSGTGSAGSAQCTVLVANTIVFSGNVSFSSGCNMDDKRVVAARSDPRVRLIL